MALAWSPEPLATLQARYTDAVTEIYGHDRIVTGWQQRVGAQRKHVFDFEDGLRLIVSRHRFPNHRVGIAISGSIVPSTEVHTSLLPHGAEAGDQMCRIVQERWRVLSGSTRDPELLGWSTGKGVPHFVVFEDD